MTIAHLLVDFGNYHASGTADNFSDATLEEHQLEAFEQGYQAGWDDSAKAHAAEGRRISTELAATFQDWSFTFKDAQTQLLHALKPMFEQISQTLLPALAQTGSPHILVEQLMTLAEEQAGETMHLYVSPDEQGAIARHLQHVGHYAIELHDDPALSAGEFRLLAGHDERQIDINQVVRNVQQALAALTHTLERTRTDAK